MATWKAENSMLTQVGVEILNKIKAGVGSITVTRVVAGSERVPASQLFQQTALSGDTKPMVITQKDVRDSGSEISIYITNEDYIEPFNLNQIGVYVSHPDYLEEQLYHISQCEEVGFDVIPALDETPVTFGYSLFLEHGNSESINLTVDPQGMVKVQDFEKFKSTMFLPNLLDNWYFANPVSTGESSRLVDRWHLVAGAMELTEQGIQIKKADSLYGYGSFETKITNDPNFFGKQVTLSVLTTEGLFSKTGIVDVSTNDSATVIYGTGANRSRFRVYFSNDYTYGEFLSFSDNDPEVIAVKVELGSGQTLAHQDSDGNWILNEIPNFAEEAAKCAQYHKDSGDYLGAVPSSLVYGRTIVTSAEQVTSAILNFFRSMPNESSRTIILHCSVGNILLEGGTWFLTIDKASSEYGMITARKYLSSLSEPGLMMKTCSIYQGQVTNWGILNFSAVVPATLE